MTQTLRRIGLVALLLGGSQLLSRGLGVLREMVLAFQVGAGPEADAYRAAFQLPDLLNHLLAVAAIATAFIPLYRRALERDGEAAAAHLFQIVWGTLTLAATLFTLLLFAFTEPFVTFYFRDFDAETQALTVRLTRIVLPAQVFFVSGGILRAVLMAQGRFGAQALAPVLYNLGIIAGGGLLGGALGVEGFAWGALVGAATGHLLLPLLDARGRVPLRPRMAPLDPAFRRYLWLALPLLVGVTLVSADEWLDRYFGQFLGAGAIALLFYARALLQAPVGLVGQAVGTAALPVLAELHEQGRAAELRALVERTLQVTLFLGVFAAAALYVLALPLVQVLYVHGAFTSADGSVVAALLGIFALGLPGWVLQSVTLRVFYARGDTWRPMWLGSIITLLAIPLYAVLARRFGAQGLAVAGAIAITVNALLTLLLSRRLHQTPGLIELSKTGLRSVLVSVPVAALAHVLVQQVAAPPPGAGFRTALLQLALGGAVFLVAGLPLAYHFADAATRTRLRALLLRSRSDAAR